MAVPSMTYSPVSRPAKTAWSVPAYSTMSPNSTVSRTGPVKMWE
nr:hypothetical protein [Fodinicola feengrottensis]